MLMPKIPSVYIEPCRGDITRENRSLSEEDRRIVATPSHLSERASGGLNARRRVVRAWELRVTGGH